MQNVLVCLSAKFCCITFYTIPYKYNRILKTQSELEAEFEAKEKRKKTREENIRKSSKYRKTIKMKKKEIIIDQIEDEGY
jgi:hypothetical protein